AATTSVMDSQSAAGGLFRFAAKAPDRSRNRRRKWSGRSWDLRSRHLIWSFGVGRTPVPELAGVTDGGTSANTSQKTDVFQLFASAAATGTLKTWMGYRILKFRLAFSFKIKRLTAI